MEDGAFDGLTNLRYLSYTLGHQDTERLSSCFIDMSSLQTLIITKDAHSCDVLPQDILRGLNNLTVFSSTGFFCKPHPEMFQHTPRLLDLKITKNDFWKNPRSELLKPIADLQSLDLSQNHLKSLDIISEANLTKLERLILANNELRIIDETIFKRLPSLKYLDLSGNPFVCNCSNAGFIYWMLRDKQVFVADAFQYRCSYPLSHEGELLLNFNIQPCFESVGFSCFITSSSLVLLTLLSSFTYHFLRWQLVYGYYLFRAFLYDGKGKKEGCADVYDAFVSYNVHDEEWVYHELVPELEERQGWRLCLHHRDFEPGKAILENITDAIYSSRKTLCVISPQYLQSEWCSRELQMASFRLFDEQKDVLILLFLEEISPDQLSPFYRMRKLVKSRTYLSWTQARSHEGLFWERVRRALESGKDPTDTHDPLTANI
nr:TLR23n [Mugilogobius chulae]